MWPPGGSPEWADPGRAAARLEWRVRRTQGLRAGSQGDGDGEGQSKRGLNSQAKESDCTLSGERQGAWSR